MSPTVFREDGFRFFFFSREEKREHVHENVSCRIYLTLIFLLLSHTANAEEEFLVDCLGSPNEAVMKLPAPLSNWGKVVCSKYGHIIGPKDGWIWSQPGGFAQIFIPAQMVKEKPNESGNSIYFSRISFKEATEAEKLIVNKFMGGFDQEPGKSEEVVYKLVVTNNSEESQTLFIFDNPSDPNKWGIWCRNECKEVSHFMALRCFKWI